MPASSTLRLGKEAWLSQGENRAIPKTSMGSGAARFSWSL